MILGEISGYITVPKGIEDIGTSLSGTAITGITLPRDISEIQPYAFYGCTSVKELVLSSGLTSIGKQAFRNCSSLTSVVLGNNIETIGAHAFYDCTDLTIYLENTQAGENWHKYWNSAYRPAIWGCTLSEDKDYVVSFVKNSESIVNKNTSNTISAPSRKGYTFLGWHTSSSATTGAYTAETFIEVTDGRKLFAVWAENT